MTNSKEKKNRQYSPIYEKAVPIAIGIMIFLVVGVLLFAGAVALDLIPLN
jgi:hypothetical protein